MYHTSQSNDNPLLSYYNSFLRPSHPYKWFRETFGLPRKRNIIQVNSNSEISRGYKTVGRYFDPLDHGIKDRIFGLSHFRKTKTTNNYGRLQRSLALNDHAVSKKWFLTSYPEDRMIQFVQFDLDRHFRNLTEEQRQQVDDRFWQTVSKLVALDIPLLWSTSPGDIVDGEHIQGLYCWIKLDQPVMVRELRQHCNQFVRCHNLSGLQWNPKTKQLDEKYIESNVDSKGRAIRLLGQRYVELVTVDPLKKSFTLVEPEPVKGIIRNKDRFEIAVQAWHELPVTANNRILLSGDIESVEPVSQADTYKILGKSGSQSTAFTASNNTFTDICKAASSVVIKHGGDSCVRDQIIKEVEAIVRCSHGSGNTCNDKNLLRRKVSREVDRYLGSYDPDELLKKRKKNEKQQQRVDSFREMQKSTDLMIIAPLRKIEPEELNHVLRKEKISQSTRHFLCRWLEAAKSQCGRVAVKRRSVSDAGVSMIEMAGSYRKYRQIKEEIDTRGLWKIVEGHSHANHSCRLVTLSDEILSSFRAEEDDSFSQE